ncbi:MAG: recombinase family protein [Acidobacteriaceae bacterium]|nr:recombinase family protein [Acidobacteriaceae bacterium]MBV9778717.1 recombinase family protein [Acidobacteriaceae bacterium]
MTQHSRELVAGPITLDYFMKRAAEGWSIAAIEWVREVEAADDQPYQTSFETKLPTEEIPYGLRIAEDGLRLEPNPIETTVLLLILEKIVIEKRLTQIAADLNQRGYRTRKGTQWSPSTIFDLLPRLIEVGPKLLTSAEWRDRRSHIDFTQLQV